MTAQRLLIGAQQKLVAGISVAVQKTHTHTQPLNEALKRLLQIILWLRFDKIYRQNLSRHALKNDFLVNSRQKDTFTVGR